MPRSLGRSRRRSLRSTRICASRSPWRIFASATRTGRAGNCESLAVLDGKNAIYPYWLGRLDYDGHEYNRAIRDFQQAIALDPRMARAYDNLGLCYYYQNQNDLAVQNYEKAIELDRGSAHPSAWPYLNLAITQQFLNRLADAEKNLREAIRLDPGFCQGAFSVGDCPRGSAKARSCIG